MRVHLKAHEPGQNESLPQMDMHFSVTAKCKQGNLVFAIAPTQEGLFLPLGRTMSCLPSVAVAIYQEAGWTGMNVTWGRERPCMLHRGILCLGIHNLLRLLLPSCIDGGCSTLYTYVFDGVDAASGTVRMTSAAQNLYRYASKRQTHSGVIVSNWVRQLVILQELQNYSRFGNLWLHMLCCFDLVDT